MRSEGRITMMSEGEYYNEEWNRILQCGVKGSITMRSEGSILMRSEGSITMRSVMKYYNEEWKGALQWGAK